MKLKDRLDLKGLILICEKCGKHASVSAKQIKDEFKSHLREEGLKRDFRPLVTSCLDICPKEGIAVATVPVKPHQTSFGARVFVLPDSHINQDAINEIVASLES